MPALQGKRALVTGASSGIGVAIARELAARGCALVLTARREDRLSALAGEIRERHGVPVTVVPDDLARPGGAAAVFDAATADGAPLDVLVNNAGFGDHETFAAAAWERLDGMLRLNATALTELTWRFVRSARDRGGPAWVLNVASTAAFQPVPGFAVYAATKSYVRHFSEALAEELRGTGVTVTCLAPGGVHTEFAAVAGMELPGLAQKTMMSAERCADIAIRGMLRGRRVVVPGFLNRLGAALARIFPRRLVIRVAGAALGPRPSERAPPR